MSSNKGALDYISGNSVYREADLAELARVKREIKKLKEEKPTYRIPIRGGYIETTDPDKYIEVCEREKKLG